MEKIKLMLVDDHDVVRTGLKTFLQTQEGLEVVAEANSGESALQVLSETSPDLVVMDITMPGMDGLETTRRMKVLYPQCKILALTVHEDKQYFFEMLAAGADGYITKQVAAEELVEAIRAVAVGQVFLQATLAAWLLEDYRRLLVQSPVQDYGRTGRSRSEGVGTPLGAGNPGVAVRCRRDDQYRDRREIGYQSQDRRPAPRACHEQAEYPFDG